MIVYAIDPGPTKCGVVEINDRGEVLYGGNDPVEIVLNRLMALNPFSSQVVVEDIQFQRGNVIGRSTISTCKMIGRIQERCGALGLRLTLITRSVSFAHAIRRERKRYLKSFKSPDARVRMALIDRYGGDEAALVRDERRCDRMKCKSGDPQPDCQKCGGSGLIHAAGPLSQVKNHAWSALALAHTFLDQRMVKQSLRSARRAQ